MATSTASSRPATLGDVALRTGVSKDTVARVLRGEFGYARPAFAKRAARVRRMAEQLGYRPNAAAKTMRSGRSPHIGVLIRNAAHGEAGLTNPLGFEMIMGINFGLEKAGYMVSLVRLDDMHHPDTSPLRIFREHVLEGMIVVSFLPEDVASSVQGMFANCIWCDANTWQPTHCIHRDEKRAGRLAAKAILGTGIRRLIYFGGPVFEPGHYSAADRRRGVFDAAETFGAEVVEVVSSRNHCAVATKEVLPRLSPDMGVVVAGVGQARGLVAAAALAGAVPGRDFALTCCDDSNELEVQMPALTRTRFNRSSMGDAAARMMLQQIEGDGPPESLLMKDELILGTTHMISDAAPSGAGSV